MFNCPLLSITLILSVICLNISRAGDTDQALLEEMMTLSRRVTEMEVSLDTFRETLAEKDNHIKRLEDANNDKELSQTKEKVERLENEISVLKAKNARLEDPPYSFVCGYQSNFIQENANIFYTKLIYNKSGGYNPSTNASYNGWLHTNTGIFNCHCPGTWQVTWSMTNVHYFQGDVNEIYLYKNGLQILETQQYTWVNDFYNGDYYTDTFGGRTLYLHLEEGDELELKTGSFNSLYNLITCFSLVRPDTFDDTFNEK